MRIVLGFLAGVLGLVAGWFGLALAVISLAGPDRDGGIAMGAFFQIGPFGGLVGCIAAVWLFVRFGIRRAPTIAAATSVPAEVAPPHPGGRVSRPVAIAVLLASTGLAWWVWTEFVRSPYLGHGFMRLDLQFRLPPGMDLPKEAADVRLAVEEDSGHALVTVPERWRAHEGDRAVILAHAVLSYRTSRRVVRLTLPGTAEQVWRLDLASDPDPTPSYGVWAAATGAAAGIEMNYHLDVDR